MCPMSAIADSLAFPIRPDRLPKPRRLRILPRANLHARGTPSSCRSGEHVQKNRQPLAAKSVNGIVRTLIYLHHCQLFHVEHFANHEIRSTWNISLEVDGRPAGLADGREGVTRTRLLLNPLLLV